MDYFDRQSRHSHEISAGNAMTWEEEVSAGVIAEVQQKIAAADRADTLTVKDEIFTVRGPE